mmetsp:Transcript_27394/g.74275  ORF Transcript_27394/g.74275 Transcript_27394/m.74275 type:complete len:211 (-) Transcript_27394:1012-1644(-)
MLRLLIPVLRGGRPHGEGLRRPRLRPRRVPDHCWPVDRDPGGGAAWRGRDRLPVLPSRAHAVRGLQARPRPGPLRTRRPDGAGEGAALHEQRGRTVDLVPRRVRRRRRRHALPREVRLSHLRLLYGLVRPRVLRDSRLCSRSLEPHPPGLGQRACWHWRAAECDAVRRECDQAAPRGPRLQGRRRGNHPRPEELGQVQLLSRHCVDGPVL